MITGPRSCGKSWTGCIHSKSATFLGHGNVTELALLDPQSALKGEFPHLVDEWQEVPELWDYARRNIDIGHKKGMYIFTGSSVPPSSKTKHTGIGRFATLEMRTMSLFESGNSNGDVSLSNLFNTGETRVVHSDIDYRKIINLICRGGWPGALNLEDEAAIRFPYQYLKSIIEMDMSRVDGRRRSRTTIETVLRSLARNNATLAGNPKLIEDIHNTGAKISEPTLRSYLDALKKLFVIEEQNAWHPGIRSRARVRTSPKRHFTDPSLAAAALGAKPEILYKDPGTAGFLFETLCYRDVSVYASAIGGRVMHYRDSTGLEVDQIIELDDGRWGAAEVKLGTFEFEKAATNLLRLEEKMIGQKVRKPSFLMILNGTGAAAHVRDDGIIEVPIDCLGP